MSEKAVSKSTVELRGGDGYSRTTSTPPSKMSPPPPPTKNK